MAMVNKLLLVMLSEMRLAFNRLDIIDYIEM